MRKPESSRPLLPQARPSPSEPCPEPDSPPKSCENSGKVNITFQQTDPQLMGSTRASNTPSEQITGVFGDYNGETVKGKAHGNGRLVLPSQDVYVGRFSSNRINGKGSLTLKREGIEIRGTWFENELDEGEVVRVRYGDGSWYEGELRGGQREGRGELNFSGGGRYAGQFKADLPNGRGEFFFKDGSVYRGLFENGAMKGKGVLEREGMNFEGVWDERAGTVLTPQGVVMRLS